MSIKFLYDHALVPANHLSKNIHSLEPLIKNVPSLGISTVIMDTGSIARVKELVADKQKHNPAMMFVIGIGGSNLGTQAVYEALYGKEGNQHFPLFFADTVDSDHIYALLQRAEHALKNKRNIIISVISKSGTTTETVANFECFLELLKKYYPNNYHEFVVAITDEGSALWSLAGKLKFDRLAIPKEIGGRYSVFTPVGLFPLYFAQINIDELLDGARMIVNECLQDEQIKKPFTSMEPRRGEWRGLHSALQASGFDAASELPCSPRAFDAAPDHPERAFCESKDPNGGNPAISASIIAYHYAHGKNIYDFFVFDVALESLGKWYRQLMGESLGKDGKGITPTVSIGSTDLHSVGQLYLGGPHDKITAFITINHADHQVNIPKMNEFNDLVSHLQSKSLTAIMKAILEGTQKAYAENKVPFITYVIPKKSAFYIGQFLQIKMIEMIYLGALLDVNPFDQPQVELYKIQTRKILAHE